MGFLADIAGFDFNVVSGLLIGAGLVAMWLGRPAGAAATGGTATGGTATGSAMTRSPAVGAPVTVAALLSVLAHLLAPLRLLAVRFDAFRRSLGPQATRGATSTDELAACAWFVRGAPMAQTQAQAQAQAQARAKAQSQFKAEAARPARRAAPVSSAPLGIAPAAQSVTKIASAAAAAAHAKAGAETYSPTTIRTGAKAGVGAATSATVPVRRLTAERQMDLLEGRVANSIEAARLSHELHRTAARQLDAADYALEQLRAELSFVMASTRRPAPRPARKAMPGAVAARSAPVAAHSLAA